MQLVLRHRTASGSSLDNLWDLEWSTGNVLACIRVAAAQPVVVAIPVAGARTRDRKQGQFAIARVDEATFRIEHGIYDVHLPQPRLPALSLTLTNATPDVARELARIAADPPR